MGGRSTRMGNDKAFVKWDSKTLLEHAISNLEALTSDIYLSVNTDQFEVLKDQYQCIEDLYPDKGPMGGILSALETLQENLIVVAVDMPDSSPFMLKKLIQGSSRVLAFRNTDQKWEPLPSYWPFSLTPQLKDHMTNNDLSLNSFLNIQGKAVVSELHSSAFRNLNSPTDIS